MTLAAAAASTALAEPAPAPSPCPPVATAAALEPPAAQAIACVGRLTIDGAEFLHWSEVARKADEPPPSTADHGRASKAESETEAILKEVMGFLISSDWVIEEARERGVVVSEAQVLHRYRRIAATQFPRRGELAAFLKDSGQTVADLLHRVRLNMLSQRLQRQVLAGHHRVKAQQRALRRFIRQFKGRWRARTYCEPAYAVADCGHLQSPV